MDMIVRMSKIAHTAQVCYGSQAADFTLVPTCDTGTKPARDIGNNHIELQIDCGLEALTAAVTRCVGRCLFGRQIPSDAAGILRPVLREYLRLLLVADAADWEYNLRVWRNAPELKVQGTLNFTKQITDAEV